MKKTTIGLTAISFLLLNTLHAQTKVWFKEDFNDNSKNWNLVKTKIAGLEIKEGQLYVSNGPNYVYSNEVNLYMDFNKDFTAEAKFQVNSQAPNNHSGIYITDKSGKKNYFTINVNSQTYWVGAIENGMQNNLGKTDPGQNAGWQKSALIKPVGESNVITISRKRAQIFFLINGQQVYSLSNKDFCADIRKYIGFTNFSEARVAVDYIQFDQDNWKNVIAQNEKPLAAVSLGAAINTPAEEINPVLTSDGKTLYFTRMHYKNNYEGIILGDARGDGDIYYSEFVNGEWTFAKHLAFGISNHDHNMLASVSPDGNSLLLFGTYNEKDKTTNATGGVSMTTRTKDGWTYPKPLQIKNFYTQSGKVNYYLASDWKTLILSIERKDSKGGADLYVSFKQKDDSWSEPKHTGPKINTANTEFAPFLAADGKTLYFASWDLPGYGEADMFMTKRLDDSWTNWSDPVNLGPAINNDGFNAYYKISADGKKVYFSSTLNALGEYFCDIYMADLPADLQPDPSVLVKGKVLDGVTRQPLNAKVIFKITDEDKSVVETSTDSLGTTGFTVALPSGKKYTYYALKEGYLPLDEELNLSAVNEHIEMSKDIMMTPIAVGQIAKLNNVFFKQGQAQLLVNSYPELDRLVEILKSNPTVKIELQGHTDNQGDQKLNQTLSEQRVNLVKKYLVGKGIKEDRITGKGFGGLKPLVNNDTEDNRKKNRRVEFVITNQ